MEINPEIIEKIYKRDRDACKSLYDSYHKVCFGICMRYARDRSEAQDMLQEGFLQVFKSIKSYSFNGSFSSWVKTIIFHQAMGYARKYYKQKNNIKSLEKIDIPVNQTDRLLEEELILIINSIPEKYKIVFNLYAVEQYSHKEIAQLLEINEATSRSQFMRARNLIKQKLDRIERLENKKINYGA